MNGRKRTLGLHWGRALGGITLGLFLTTPVFAVSQPHQPGRVSLPGNVHQPVGKVHQPAGTGHQPGVNPVTLPHQPGRVHVPGNVHQPSHTNHP